MRPRWIFCSLLASSLLLVQFSTAQTGDFTIIALPDTQNEAQFFPGVLLAQTRWIVNHRAELNIQMVLGEGDIVNDFADPEQQESAEEAFHLLDKAGVPYMLAIGNHDYDRADPKDGRPVSGFNRFFGPSRYAAKPYYRGGFPDGSNENFFGVQEIGGKEFLFLILEFVPRPESMDWAESVLRANPDKEVIVVTHSFTYIDNTRVDMCDTSDMPAGNETGDDMWAVLRKYPNIEMVLSGHLTDGQAARRADLGDQGNLINQVFTNYQTFPHGGDGWLRIMTFHPAANTITVRTFSPSLNRFRTDQRNQFTLFYHNPHQSRGNGTVSGLVRNFSTCEPVAGIAVGTGGASAVTDAKGHYQMTLSPGTYSFTASAPGWKSEAKSETVNDSFDTDLNFYLTPGPPPLCAVSSVSPSVTICSPQNQATVTSPVQVVVATTDDRTVLSTKALLDGKRVLESHNGRLSGFIDATTGPHRLDVIAHDAANVNLEQAIDFLVAGPPSSGTALSLGVTPSSARLNLGDSADFNLSVSGDGSLAAPVTLACHQLPPGSHCTFDQNKIKGTDLPSTVKLTVFTTALVRSDFPGTHFGFTRWAVLIFGGSLLLGLIFVDIANGRRKGRRMLIWMGLLGAVALVGCAGLEAPSNRGTFTITVTGTSGKVQKSTTIELALQ